MQMKRYQAVRLVIDRLVADLCDTLLARVQGDGIATLADVRRVKPRLVEFSATMGPQHAELKAFLSDRLYHHQCKLLGNTTGDGA